MLQTAVSLAAHFPLKTCRVRVALPLPQVLLHGPHTLHRAALHLGTQPLLPHERLSTIGGQSASLADSTSIFSNFRVRVCVPPSHFWLQMPQDPHCATLHTSGGQTCSPHLRFSVRSAGHGLPLPCANCFTVRIRVCSPPEHALQSLHWMVHLLHSDQAFMWQSSGEHGSLLHGSTSTASGHFSPCFRAPL